ncbi:MAG: hypothetical protein AB7P03_02025 [Kofleriaceae bacterium]
MQRHQPPALRGQLFALLIGLTAATGCAVDAPGSDSDNGKQDSTELGDIAVNGKSIPRLERAPLDLAPEDDAKMLTYVKAFGAKRDGDTNPQYRSEEFVDDVFTSEYALDDANGAPLQIGEVAYVRPGLGGTMASAAQIYLLAQHFKTVVLLYTNMTETDPAYTTALRKVDTGVGILDPVVGTYVPSPVPLDNIYAIGSAHYALISYQQQSDTTLEQLELLRQGWERDDFPFDPFAQTDAWIFAHSQANPDAVMTNARLETAGFKPYGKIVAMGSAILGCRVGGTMTWDNATNAARETSGGGEQAANAYAALVPLTVRTNLATVLGLADPGEQLPIDTLTTQLREPLRERIAYAIAPVVHPGPDLPLMPVEDKGDVRIRYYNLAGMADFEGTDGKNLPNDGLENLDSLTSAAQSTILYKVDHMGVFEGPQHMLAALKFITGK